MNDEGELKEKVRIRNLPSFCHSLKKKEKEREESQKTCSLQTKCAISYSRYKPPLNTPPSSINPLFFFLLSMPIISFSMPFGNAIPNSPLPLGPQEYPDPASFHLPHRNTPPAHLPPPHQS